MNENPNALEGMLSRKNGIVEFASGPLPPKNQDPVNSRHLVGQPMVKYACLDNCSLGLAQHSLYRKISLTLFDPTQATKNQHKPIRYHVVGMWLGVLTAPG